MQLYKQNFDVSIPYQLMPKTRFYKNEFEIRSLTAKDFFGSGGFPIQFFKCEKPKTMYEQIAGEKQAVNQDSKKQIEFMQTNRRMCARTTQKRHHNSNRVSRDRTECAVVTMRK